MLWGKNTAIKLHARMSYGELLCFWNQNTTIKLRARMSHGELLCFWNQNTTIKPCARMSYDELLLFGTGKNNTNFVLFFPVLRLANHKNPLFYPSKI
ncbi:hypothetical protein BM613_13515 [Sulfoacidibacillus thermotolerans]|uniref:Uncharacterized protein n=1 Tax=Sulfoacidibacillus thermotolerans TaxID=1765684 RepID=A0A2U3D0V2_SULT2|nr:hypothetical protein BM613_13515 [Sulfoacidibacillus thermotolerans]